MRKFNLINGMYVGGLGHSFNLEYHGVRIDNVGEKVGRFFGKVAGKAGHWFDRQTRSLTIKIEDRRH